MKSIKEWFKKSKNWSMALLLIAILGVGMTMAYFTDIETAINSFTVGSIGTETDEKVEGVTKTGVGVIATGNSECYVRMRVDIPTTKYVGIDGIEHQAMITLVKASDDNAITATVWNNYTSKTEIPASIIQDGEIINSEAKWKKYSDGFWYLSTVLQKNQKATIVDKITYPGLMQDGVVVLPDGVTYDMLTISITSEAVQTIDGVSGAYATFQEVNGN